MARLGDIVKIAPSTAPLTGEQQWLLNLDMVEQQTGRVIAYNYVDADELDGSIIQFDTDAVLYSKLRPNLNKVVLPEQPGFATSEMLPLVPDTAVLTREYLTCFLRSDSFVTWAVSKTAGAKMPRLGSKELLGKEIPLPSIAEQDSIAQQFVKVDTLISLRKQQIAKLDELVKARFVEMFGDPVSNQKKWPLFALGSRCELITGNTPSRAEKDNYGDFIEWIKSDNINTPNTYLTTAQEGLSEIGYKKGRFVEAGSILMTCIAGSISCIGNVAIADRKVAFNQQINAIVPKQDEVLFLYWLMLLAKPIIHSPINMSLKGILSKGQLSEMKFPFPPLELQHQFAAFVAQTDQQKLTIQHSLDKLELLKKVLMQKYFG